MLLFVKHLSVGGELIFLERSGGFSNLRILGINRVTI